MRNRAQQLISEHGLQAHPEGGYFREIFRSGQRVQPLDERSTRAALTVIYYLLEKGQHSRWHRVKSDETWHFYEGNPLEVDWIDNHDVLHQEMLGAGPCEAHPVCVVPAGCWQAARPLGEYSFVGCVVAPGFEFQDFAMLSDESAMLARVASLPPALASLV